MRAAVGDQASSAVADHQVSCQQAVLKSAFSSLCLQHVLLFSLPRRAISSCAQMHLDLHKCMQLAGLCSTSLLGQPCMLPALLSLRP